jgi:branched-chain amino acid transport system permease protein
MLLVSMIGGAGTIFGPLIGAGVLHFVSEVTRELGGALPAIKNAQPLALIVYGVILVIIVGYLPDGLMGLFRRRKPVPQGQGRA